MLQNNQIKISLYRGEKESKRLKLRELLHGKEDKVDKEAETQYHFRISSLKAVDRNARGYSFAVLKLMFCLNCDCVQMISGKILPSVPWILIVIPGISYRESLYRGSTVKQQHFWHNRNYNKILDFDWFCARLFVA